MAISLSGPCNQVCCVPLNDLEITRTDAEITQHIKELLCFLNKTRADVNLSSEILHVKEIESISIELERDFLCLLITIPYKGQLRKTKRISSEFAYQKHYNHQQT